MSLVFTVDDNVIESVLEQLKLSGIVSREAFFNYNAPDNLRKEVTYRDPDFLRLLSQTSEIEIVDSALEMLKRSEYVPRDADYNKEAFTNFRKEVGKHFKVPMTSITPVMERLLYMLSSVKKPKNIMAVGIYCGNTLAWVAGASCGNGKVYDAGKIYGIDIDADAIEGAKRNFGKLAYTDHIHLIQEDGLIIADELDESFDYIYLDVDSKEKGKGLYLDLLKKFYPKLSEDGWVLAHDTTHPYIRNQLGEYLDFVRKKDFFTESISFPVDFWGLELSIK
jgi:predicted O-methyltransferase YrrM